MAKRAKLDEHGGNVPEDYQRLEVWQKWPKPRRLVTGVTYREQAFLDLIGPRRPGGYCQAERVTLEREPSNEHDDNAIRVVLKGQHIGYIARDVAATLATAMDEQDLLAFDVPALIVGGSTSSFRKEFGCWPWLWKAFETDMRIGRHGDIEELKPYGTMWTWYTSWTSSNPPNDEPDFSRHRDEDDEDDDDLDDDDDELPAVSVARDPRLKRNRNFFDNLQIVSHAVAKLDAKANGQAEPTKEQLAGYEAHSWRNAIGCAALVVLTIIYLWLMFARTLQN
jgi:hypothetical protein